MTTDDDIVTRLRGVVPAGLPPYELLDEAADEIERLRVALLDEGRTDQ